MSISMRGKKTLVIGASINPARYAYQAIHRLRQHGVEVVAIGRSSGIVSDVSISSIMTPYEDVDTITIYLRPDHQEGYKSYLLSLQPRRIIFNPGTENPMWYPVLEELQIEVVEACTLVMIATGDYFHDYFS